MKPVDMKGRPYFAGEHYRSRPGLVFRPLTDAARLHYAFVWPLDRETERLRAFVGAAVECVRGPGRSGPCPPRSPGARPVRPLGFLASGARLARTGQAGPAYARRSGPRKRAAGRWRSRPVRPGPGRRPFSPVGRCRLSAG